MPKHTYRAVQKATSRVTIAAINKELERRGHKERLVKGEGEGYFYLVGGRAHDMFSSSVSDVYRLSHLTLDQWVETIERKLSAYDYNVKTFGYDMGARPKPGVLQHPFAAPVGGATNPSKEKHMARHRHSSKHASKHTSSRQGKHGVRRCAGCNLFMKRSHKGTHCSRCK